MTINERIKLLRKEKHMNQKQFASLLGITQSGVSYMEQPGNNISDSSIKSICTVCNANEEWLRSGNEPMRLEPDTFSLDEFIRQHGGTDLELNIVKTYFELDPDLRKTILQHFKTRLSAVAPEQEPPAAADLQKLSIDERTALFRQELEREEKAAEGSQALPKNA